MRELSLFTGAGGGLLGTKLLGWEPIGYVEFNDYCQRVIKQRIIDGILPNAPIFGDIKAFIDSGCAELYRGVTDVITGGFPCQPHSRAGKQLASDDERDMWTETLCVIKTIKPEWLLLENVPGIIDTGYVWRVTADLAGCGYVGLATNLSALGLGANHKRDRIWFIAQRADYWEERIHRSGETSLSWKPSVSWGENVGRLEKMRVRPDLPERGLCRSQHDVPSYVDRISAIGNAQFPPVVRAVWNLCTELAI